MSEYSIITNRETKDSILSFEELEANFVLFQNVIDSIDSLINITFSNFITDYNNFKSYYDSFKTSTNQKLQKSIHLDESNVFTNVNTFNETLNLSNAIISNGILDNVLIGSLTPNDASFSELIVKSGIIDFSGSSYLRLPQWSNTTRPYPLSNLIGFNTSSNKYEVWNGTVWEFFYTSSNAGTSMSYDVTTSHTDQTTNHLLLVGDYGLGSAIHIPANADLNTYLIPGNYCQTANVNASSGTNYPVAYAGSLEVLQSTSASGVVQRYNCYNNPDYVYIRAYNTDSGAWTAWRRFITNDVAASGLNPKVNLSGDTMSGSLTVSPYIRCGVNSGANQGNIYVGSATYFWNGNIWGTVWGSNYLSTWLNNTNTALVNNRNSRIGARTVGWYGSAYSFGISGNWNVPNTYFMIGSSDFNIICIRGVVGR